jgi:hypothetical protein
MLASFGCGLPAELRTPTPASARTPVNNASATPAARPPDRNAVDPAPTAVRLLSVDPKDVVLRPIDLNSGYVMSAESSTTAVQVWHPRSRSAEPNVRSIPGLGYYVLLARPDKRDVDEVISLASTAVRYDSTLVAHAQFAFESEPSYDYETLLADKTDLGDEVRAWRHSTALVIVDQVLLRRLNVLLSLTLVRTPGTGEGSALQFAKLMRTKLHD